MRLRALALALLAAAPLAPEAQPAARVDLVLRGVPAREALARLASTGAIDLVYDTRLVGRTRVWCGGARQRPEAVLGCIADAAGLDYVRRSSGTYVLVEKVERAPETGALAGRVVDAVTGEPLPFAHVVLRDAGAGAATDASGAFVVGGIVAGPQTVTASYVGYAPATLTVDVASGERAVRQIALRPEVVASEPVVIDGMQARPVSAGLGAGELLPAGFSAPGAAPTSDALRSAESVLGVAPLDFRDGLSIQGGETGQHPLRLDGATVYEPVALGTAVGAMSPLAVGRVTVRKAGFGARHGSFLAGVLDAEHRIPEPGLRVVADALAANASGAFRQRLGGVDVAGAVSARRSLWDVARPRALDDALRDWNTVDPVIAATLGGAPTDALTYDAHRHGSDVAFSDLHAAARLAFGPLRTLRLSVYRGASEVGTELFAAGTDRAGGLDPSALVLSRDRYRWTNTASTARYSWLAGPRLLLGADLRFSRHTLRHAYEAADGALAGLTGDEPTPEAEDALRATLDAHDAGDDGNRLTEVTVAATAEVSLAPGHTLGAVLEASGVGSRFHLGAAGPTASAMRPLDADETTWRLAAVLDDEIALGRGWTAEPGLRLTLLPDGRAYAEPRAALRADATRGPLAGVSARLAAGLYRQYVVRYDLATLGPSALVPDVAVWVPTSGIEPPQAAHLAGEILWTPEALASPEARWQVRAEGYLKAEPRVLTLDYSALLAETADPLTRQADFVLAGEGRAAGIGVRVERRGPRVALLAGAALSHSERRFDGRFGGDWNPTAWEEPVAVTLGADWAALGTPGASGVTLRARARGVWGRSWAFRRAYYEVLSASPADFAPFDLSDPGADGLPALLDLDLGIALRQRLGGSMLHVGLDLADVLGRDNALDWWLRRSGAGYKAVTRAAPGFQPSVRVRLEM